MSATPPRTPPPAPAATYRLQLTPDFGFDQARALVPYLSDLGVSHAYLSPIFASREGSTHGYDGVDPTRLEPELGGEAGFLELAAALGRRGLGVLADIVPNHLCVTDAQNRWWRDILAHGPASPYAGWFDIDWTSPEVTGAPRLRLPLLGEPFGAALEGGVLRPVWRRGFALDVYGLLLPLAPETWPAILRPLLARLGRQRALADADLAELKALTRALAPRPPATEPGYRARKAVARRTARLLGQPAARPHVAATLARLAGRPGRPASFDRLQGLLDAQHYRLLHWRLAPARSNYRRFFDINDLAALRMERPEVFRATHRKLFALIAAGAVQGLRIDHPDGLRDPGEYFRRLQAGCARALGRKAGRGGRGPAFYVVAEKILERDERLPADWPVAGTTGYEAAVRLNGLFVRTRNGAAFRALTARLTGAAPDFAAEVVRAKRMLIRQTFAADWRRVMRALREAAAHDRHARDLPGAALEAAAADAAANLPVYRTYVSARGASAADRAVVQRTLGPLAPGGTRGQQGARTFLARVWLLDFPRGATPALQRAWETFTWRWQQFTGPLMAKGLEDTALYRVVPLASLNDVGGGPEPFGDEPADLHRWLAERQTRHPGGLTAGSTHDSKRSEDVRARLNALSEIPGPWERAVKRWQQLNTPHRATVSGRTVPDAAEELFCYQTLVGAWPLGGRGDPAWAGEGGPGFPERMAAYLLKAQREAKVHTNWTSPNAAHEKAMGAFLAALLADGPGNPFPADLERFLAPVARAGLFNSLAQTVLRVTVPGVPDVYQGTELWDFSLVDPDNRRPVDFGRRRRALRALKRRAAADPAGLAAELLAVPEDGRIKLYVLHRALALRRRAVALFGEGAYLPLEATGRRAGHIFAFARCLPESVPAGRRAPRAAIVAVARFTMALGAPRAPVGRAVWGDTALRLETPEGEVLPAGAWRDVLTGAEHRPRRARGGERLPLATVFRHLPLAVLESVP